MKASFLPAARLGRLAVPPWAATAWMLILLPSTPAAPQAQIVFTDVTAPAGLALPGVLTESVAWGDIDGDGDSDLYLSNNGPNVLLRNDGLDPQGQPVFTDISAAAGVDHPGFSVGAAFGDLDNDGDNDLYVVSFGAGPDALLQNAGTDPGGITHFTDITFAAGIVDQSSSRGMALVDVDRDGLLDIYVNAIGPDILYHNQGGLVFTNIAAAAGVDTNTGQGVGVVTTDVNGDGLIDLFTGNRSFDPNRLFLNRGDGTFFDSTVASHIDQAGLGMGVCALDVDNDLDIDLYWTAWPGSEAFPQPNALYLNQGSFGVRPSIPIFDNVTVAAGVADTEGWGISCNAGDIDNDGYQDLAISNGFSPSSGANVLFHNQGDGTFADVSPALSGGARFDGRGVAFADFDLDGDVDLALSGGPSADTRLWRNDTQTTAHSLTLNLRGTVSNRSAIGARVEVETGLMTLAREVSGGAGRGSQNDLPLEIGLGAATRARTVCIRWPSGLSSEATDLDADRSHTVVESLIFANGFERGDASAWQGAPPNPEPEPR